MRHAQRQTATGQRVHQRGGKRLIGQGQIDQIPHAPGAARRVTGNRLVQRRKAMGRIVEAPDGLMQRSGVKPVQHGQKPPERPARFAEDPFVAAAVVADGIAHKAVGAPVVPVAVHGKEKTVLRAQQAQGFALRVAPAQDDLLPQVLRHPEHVVHHVLRVGKGGPVDALEHIAHPLLPRGRKQIGIVDVTAAEGNRRLQHAFRGKAQGQLPDFFRG